MSQINTVIGPPGVRAPITAFYKRVFYACEFANLPTGRYIDGSKARDTNNTPDTGVLMPGLLMGKITSSGAYANWSIDQTTVSYDGSTAMTISLAGAVELIRRIGTSGTFVLTGVPSTAGVVRQNTVTFSAVDPLTGIITVSAQTTVNEVQTITFASAATAGTMVLVVPKADGTTATTGSITWNTTDATWLSNIQTALDTATGVANAWVVSGTTPDNELIFTASGTGYSARPFTNLFAVTTLPTSTGAATVVRNSAGVSGVFTIGSVLSQADGTQNPLSFLEDGWGINVTDGTGISVTQVEWPNFPIAGVIDPTQFVGWSVMDASLKTWVKLALSTFLGGKYIYKDTF